MGRRKPAWLLQRQYQRAQAREQWLAANPPQPPENMFQSRKRGSLNGNSVA